MLPVHKPDLDELNVLKIDVDPGVVDGLQRHLEGYQHKLEFHGQCPPWNSDIEWISPNSLAMFRVYRQVFDALDPAPGGAAHPISMKTGSTPSTGPSP